ncbi:MAG: TadE/TadG family type IV pilus assembly protein, partial [Methylophilaceae bacterium]
TAIKTKMNSRLTLLQTSNININYPAVGCVSSTCQTVTVQITGVTVNTFIPFVPFSVTLPSFSTTLPTESLSSAGNSLCDG